MVNHKKHPVFIRIITNEHVVVCINPLQLSSFQIVEKAKLVNKEGETYEADTIRFFFPSGTGLSYSVGKDITAEDFLYICNTLREFVYLNEPEFKNRTAALDAQRMADWNKIMQDVDEEEKAVTEPPKEA